MSESLADIPAGRFTMGSEDFYSEEAPARDVEVGAFRIEAHPVTVREFRRFVKATGHVTTAEYGSQMLSLGGVDHLTGGSRAEGNATLDTLLALCSREQVELAIDGDTTDKAVILRAVDAMSNVATARAEAPAATRR